jgi:hypothetical protein
LATDNDSGRKKPLTLILKPNHYLPLKSTIFLLSDPSVTDEQSVNPHKTPETTSNVLTVSVFISRENYANNVTVAV